jgi:hypothetical protein
MGQVYTAAPPRWRQSVERYKIVMSGRRPLIEGLFSVLGRRGYGHVSGLLLRCADRWP